LGLALQEALKVVDDNFTGIPADMNRHIILLTDGAWDDAKINPPRDPQTLINEYIAANSGRALPFIHGVFISDSATHVEHGYPPHGCSNTDSVDLSYLQSASESLGKGLFFGGSTPQTISSTFLQLLNSVVVPMPRTLKEMKITSLSTGEVRNSTIQTVASTAVDETHYEAAISNLPLQFGSNPIQVLRIIQRPGTDALDTVIDTVTIFRTTDWTSTIIQKEYDEFCVNDSTSISITVTPPDTLLNSPFTVKSTIILKDKFNLNNIEVRILTRFPDKDDNSLAVFHFEENLDNSANPGSGGAGTVSYTATNALFGEFSVSQGSLSATIPTLANDFALEAWVRPVSGGGQTDIFSKSGTSFGINADGFLYFTENGTGVARSTMALDPNTWSHIAAVKAGGKLILFINGVSSSDAIPFTGTFAAGAITISCPAGGMLDEVRISSVSRLRDEPRYYRLDIPSVPNITWTMAGQSPVTRQNVVLTPQMWNNGNIQFQFASPVSGKLVVNFQHEGTSESQWGKNGNPVWVPSDIQGPYITKAIFTNGPIGESYDTLVVFFSEPVLCDSLKQDAPVKSFRIYQGNDLKPSVFEEAYYSDRGSCPQSGLITQTTIITKAIPNGIVPSKDSILLVGATVDTAGNRPDTTRKGPVVWGPGSGILIRAVPGEEVSPMQIRPGVKDRTGIKENVGKVIVLQTRGPLLPMVQIIDGVVDTTYGKTVIFDAVGNVVAVDKAIKPFSTNDRMYYVFWDGTNRIGRKVASAAYLLRATVQYANEPSKYVPLKTKFSLSWNPVNQ